MQRGLIACASKPTAGFAATLDRLGWLVGLSRAEAPEEIDDDELLNSWAS